MPLELTTEWYINKTKSVKAALSDEGLDAILLLDPFNIFYAGGFFHQSTERPLGMFIRANGDPILYVPALEKEMAEDTWVSAVKVYFDYPMPVHPINWMLDDNKDCKHVGIDRLSHREWEIVTQEHPGVSMSDLVYTMRLVKDEKEIAILETAARYADMCCALAKEAIYDGMSELDAFTYAGNTMTNRMTEDLGDLVYANQGVYNGAVLYGPHSAHPHGLMSANNFAKNGNVIQAGFGALVCTYESESEHCFLYGDPDKQTVSYFNAMYSAWKAGWENAKPGMTCAQLNEIVLGKIKEAGYERFLRHRMGHGKGLEEHEAPWVAEGDFTILKPGMCISDEPGLYVPGYGGFRHSDTILITETGCRRLTQFPRELESCIIPIRK